MRPCCSQQLHIKLSVSSECLNSPLRRWFLTIRSFRFATENAVKCRDYLLQAGRGKLLRTGHVDSTHSKMTNRKPGRCNGLTHYFRSWNAFHVGISYSFTNFSQPLLFSFAYKTYLLVKLSRGIPTQDTKIIWTVNSATIRSPLLFRRSSHPDTEAPE